MIQNHTMQLVALTAMEPPVSLDPECIRDEKVKVLKAIQPLELKPEGGDVVRARYSHGLVNGSPEPAYADEVGIPADSALKPMLPCAYPLITGVGRGSLLYPFW